MLKRTISRAISYTVALLSSLSLIGCTTAWHDDADMVLPPILGQPQNVTVMATQDAVFSVAVGGTGHYAYQWYVDGAAIQGATAATYTVPSAAVSQSGSQYTVAITDTAGTSRSGPALLTVKALDPKLTFALMGSVPYTPSPLPVSASSLSNAQITYSVKSGPATFGGGVLTLLGVGAVTLSASQPASGNYAAGTATTVLRVDQNVAVSSIAPANQTIAPGQVNFAASATGGLTDTLIWSASGGSFTGSTWTSPSVAGTYTIRAQSADDLTRFATTTMTVTKPVITQQPSGSGACPATNPILTVLADYAQSYQWSKDGSPISSATANSYTVPSNNNALIGGSYSVTASNAAGSVESIPAVVTSGSQIVTPPASVSVPEGQTATFAVVASGRGPLTYQWFQVPYNVGTNIPIPNATGPTYTTPVLTTNQSGTRYYAEVTDVCGTLLVSAMATLTVTPTTAPPTIDQQPVSVTVLPNATPSFTAHASGTPNLMYQWYVVPAANRAESDPIPGATAPTYTLPPTATQPANDQDSYYVRVTNSYGTAASTAATLTVGGGIVITQQPVSQFVSSGAPATLSVTATSALPLSYQWYSAPAGSATFTPIVGASGSQYKTPPTVTSDSGSSFYAVVSNGVTASVTSQTADVFVDQPTGAADCNWIANGDAYSTGPCAFQLTDGVVWQNGALVLPTLVSTASIVLSFTETIDETSELPADGFAITFGDPSRGASLNSVGMSGQGLGALGIPGTAVVFDTYYNPAPWWTWPAGDLLVPYIAITRSDNLLFENPFFAGNSNIPQLAAQGQSLTHDFVVTVASGVVTVTMDGNQVLSGAVSIPSAAYLFITSSTGGCWERLRITNLKAMVAH